jgi:replicative DNA helicase
MADAERQLVSKAAHTGQVEPLLRRGIGAQHFVDPEAKSVWEFMRDHTVKYGAAPSMKVLSVKFPQYRFEIVQDALDYCADLFTREVRRREAIDAIRDVTDLIDQGKLDNIEEAFLERARQLSQVVPNPTSSRFSQMFERIKAYHDMITLGNFRGVPFGIPTLDNLTMGIQPHELVTIVGWQSLGKSTLMQYISFNAYMAGKTGLILSLEMEERAVQRKLDVMATNLLYHDVKSGQLTKGDLKKWEAMAAKAQKAKNDIIVVDNLGKCTVDRVYAEMVKYKPDFCCVDYITLMHTRDGQAMWEKVTYITQGLKQVARSLKIPIIAAAQTNVAGAEEGARLTNVAYSKSIGQDSDIVLGLHRDEEMRQQKRMEVRINKNRDGEQKTIMMHWEPEKMVFHEIGVADMFKRRHDAGQ